MNTSLRVSTVLLSIVSLVLPLGAYAAPLTATSPSPTFGTTLIALTNADRTVAGMAPLTPSALLTAAAQKKADNMMANGYFAHTSPSGISPWYWITSVGYYYTHAGENLALNFTNPAQVEAAWMASPGHRANLLRGLYTQVGIGIANGTYHGMPATFIVELFATPEKTQPA